MKKIFAIAMLVLFLFNLGGYQLLFQYFIYESDVSITQQINNNNYKPADLVEVKIPVQLNNFQSWDEFKPVSGQVKVKDNCYNYAALKMTRDTMYLMVIPNHDKAHIINAKNIYAKQINGIPLNKKSHEQTTKKANTLSEYNLLALQDIYSRYGIFLTQTNKPVSLKFDRPFIESPVKPPNFIG
ncbi:hypothetical protein SAMN05216490_3436 [Mucilaginibacter mallensis]|uniref:Uncharacterized protein n=1 Tax=Mucilaginibacter mallensis TaxID=652787 RepID=A0A1H2A9D2_MUCMA|nr:hypothetical protein [Mucilaginibacter mallensis]SDT42600.1 hypothetical protein SAMN05216490_3436 [Mucilaginibacter mallensis]